LRKINKASSISDDCAYIFSGVEADYTEINWILQLDFKALRHINYTRGLKTQVFATEGGQPSPLEAAAISRRRFGRVGLASLICM
jgi:hypothetical protein